MKVCIINGSPRRNGNTAELLKPFRERLLQLGAEIDDIFLKDYKVGPCLGCYACQNVSGEYGCVQKDDAEAVWMRAGEADLLVLATPIYSWYCTAEMKALMDRHTRTSPLKQASGACANIAIGIISAAIPRATSTGSPTCRRKKRWTERAALRTNCCKSSKPDADVSRETFQQR